MGKSYNCGEVFYTPLQCYRSIIGEVVCQLILKVECAQKADCIRPTYAYRIFSQCIICQYAGIVSINIKDRFHCRMSTTEYVDVVFRKTLFRHAAMDVFFV